MENILYSSIRLSRRAFSLKAVVAKAAFHCSGVTSARFGSVRFDCAFFSLPCS